FHSLEGSARQVGLRPASNHRDDAGHTKFGDLLNRPFKPIELEDGNGNGNVRECGSREFLAEVEFNAGVSDAGNAPATHDTFRCDIEFLTDTGAENTSEMVGMCAEQKGAIAGDFVGDPAAAHDESGGDTP